MIRISQLLPSVLLSFGLLLNTSAFAQEKLTVSVHDVTAEYENNTRAKPTPPPMADDPYAPGGIAGGPGGGKPTPTPDPNIPPTGDMSTSGTLDTIITLGTKVWDFIISSKPTAEYQTLKANVVPAGVTDYTQLLWKRNKMTSKVYRVEFKTIRGTSAGGFDYRLNFIYGGTYKGKGQYIGQISVAPLNVKLHTDRSLAFKAEILDPLNFGTEEDPIAGVQLLVTWSSPTTVRYGMSSAEYMLFGDGELQVLPNSFQ